MITIKQVIWFFFFFWFPSAYKSYVYIILWFTVKITLYYFLKTANLPWSEAKVVHLCPTLCDLMDYTVHGIFQARILEWVAFPFFRGSSQARDLTQVSRTADGFFTSWATREALLHIETVFVNLPDFSAFDTTECYHWGKETTSVWSTTTANSWQHTQWELRGGAGVQKRPK